MEKSGENSTSAVFWEDQSASSGAVNSAVTDEPEGIDIEPELASLSPELNSWQGGSIAADLSPEITFYDAPE
jgi:hypothetical protein